MKCPNHPFELRIFHPCDKKIKKKLSNIFKITEIFEVYEQQL